MLIRRPKKLVMALAIAGLVTACGGAEERKAEYLERGRKYFEEHNYDKAKVEFKNVLQIDPKTAKPYFYLGQIEESKQQWREAFALYQKAGELDPSDIEVKKKLAKFYLLAQDKAKAQGLLNEIQQASPKDIEGRMLKAAIANQEGNADAALTELLTVIQDEPSRIDAYLVLAVLYEKKNDQEAILRVLQQGLDHNKGNATLLMAISKAYQQRAQNDKAEEVLRQLIASDPANAQYHNIMTQFLIQQKRFDDAEKELRASIAASPSDAPRYMALVEFLARSGKPDRAVDELVKAVASNPENADLRFGLARLYVQVRKIEPAEASFRDIIEQWDGKPEAIKAQGQLAELKLAQGKVDEALGLIDEVLKENPQDNQALMLQGKIALSRKDAQKAITAFRSVLKDQPESVDVLTLLASAQQMDGKPALAQESLEKAVQVKPDDFPARKRLVEFLVQQKNNTLALEKTDEFLRISPKNLDALNMKADLLALEKREGELETLLRQIKQDFPDNAIGAFRLGNFYQTQKKCEAAIPEFEISLTRTDNDYEPLKAITGCYLQLGQPEKALARLKKVLAEKPKHPTVNQLIAMYYAERHQDADAIKALRQAIEANPRWPVPYNNLAGLYEKDGKYDQALDVYKSALKEYPGDTAINMNMARLEERKRNFPAAIQHYESILAKNPDNLLVVNNLVALLSVDPHNSGNLQKAKDLAVKLQNMKEPAVIDTLGWLAYQSGDYQKALEQLKRAVEEQANVPIYRFHLGMAYLKTGDTAAAKTHLQQAVESKSPFEGLPEAREALKAL